MTPDEKKAKALEVAALYTALANGKTLQFDTSPNQQRMNRWEDIPEELSLSIHSDLSRWRVKPEPRRKWSTGVGFTFDEAEADQWRIAGHKVTEWVEVLP
jgi:hypothetical protein